MAAGHDYIDAADLSVDELRSALFEGSDRWSPPVALSLLGRIEYAEKLSDLARVVSDGERRLQVMAIHELGRLGTPEASEMLVRTLSHDDGAVRRASAVDLAAGGSTEARRALAEFGARAADADARTAAWSLQLLALRLGDTLERPIIERDAATIEADEREARAVAVEKLADADAERVVADISRSALRVELVAETAQHLRCGDRDYALVLTDRVDRGRLDRLGGALAILAVVADRDDVESDEWEVRYLVATQPNDDRTSDLVVVTADGRPIMVGRAGIDRAVSFELRSVDRPGAVAVDCDGHLDDGGVRFDRFVSEQRLRRRGERTRLIPEEG